MATKKRKETYAPFDAADYLRDEQDMIAYLEAVMEDGSATEIAAALGVVARAYGMVRLSQETGLARPGLYRALAADGNPSLDTVLRVLKALGMRITPKAA